MNPHRDPAFDIKQALDREVTRRFDAGRFHALDDAPRRDGPLARIPVPIQWIGIAAALIAAVTGLRSLYLDLAGHAPAAPLAVRADAVAPVAEPERREPAQAPVVERAAEPARQRRVPAPATPSEATPAPGRPAAEEEPALPPPQPEVVAQASPRREPVDAVRTPRAVESAPERPPVAAAPPAPSGGVAWGDPDLFVGGVTRARFSSGGRPLQVTVREARSVGATIVSLVGPPGVRSPQGTSERERRAGTPTLPPLPQPSYYVRLLIGTKQPALAMKSLIADPPSHGSEDWGIEAHRAFLRTAFELRTVVAFPAARTAPPEVDVPARADLLASWAGGLYQVHVSASPAERAGHQRFEVRLAMKESDEIEEIRGGLVVENSRVVVLALPDPRGMTWGGAAAASSGVTLFVVLSSRSEEADRLAANDPEVEPPIFVGGPEPRYPEGPLHPRPAGKILLRALVRADGTVADVQLVEAPDVAWADLMIEAAKQAATEQSYLPARRHGEALDAYVILGVEFTQDGGARVVPGE